MSNIYHSILVSLQQNQPIVLNTILSNNGSTPRGAGAKMLVYPDGHSEGTIGGGSGEFLATKKSQALYDSPKSFIHEFHFKPNEVEDFGSICGGDAIVFFQYIDNALPGIMNFYQMVVDKLTDRTPAWLITRIDTEGNWDLCLYTDNQTTTLNNEQNFSSLLSLTKFGINEKVIVSDTTTYYIEPLNQTGNVYIFGAGHVSQKLVPILDYTFFPCIVIDDNAKFANDTLFPKAKQIIVDGYSSVFQQLSITENDYIVIVTRGHKLDEITLKYAFTTQANYIGMIGSKGKIEKTFTDLIQSHEFSMSDINRVHAPIGLPIGGETPEEIAISIAAELIEMRETRRKESK